MNKRKFAKQARGLLLIALLLIIVYLTFEVIKVYRKLYQQGLEKETLIEQRDEQQSINDELQSDLDKKDDDDFIVFLARKLYGYVYEGERTFKDSNYSE